MATQFLHISTWPRSPGSSTGFNVCALATFRAGYRVLYFFECESVPTRGLQGGPETRGPVRVRVYILNGQPGPGRVPIYYFGSRVFLTLCVIPESIGKHRTREWSVSVSMHVFCNLQFVKLQWEKCEREIRWKKKKKTRVTSAARNRARAELMLVLQADGDHEFESSWVMWKKSWNKTEETHLLLNTHTVKCNELLILCVFCPKNFLRIFITTNRKYRYCSSKG